MDVSELKSKDSEFTRLPSITSERHPESLVMNKVQQVVFKSGNRAGTKGLVIEGTDNNGENWVYFPNKTSISTICSLYGNETDEWIGKSIRFEIAKVQVKGVGMRNGIFVKEKQ